jgi:Arc/MetJ-type ribon-helix-helix transcriptional regulator
MFDRRLNMRMDENTNHLLEELIAAKNIPSRAEAIRKAIRLMHRLFLIEQNSGEIILNGKTKDEKNIIFLT